MTNPIIVYWLWPLFVALFLGGGGLWLSRKL